MPRGDVPARTAEAMDGISELDWRLHVVDVVVLPELERVAGADVQP